MNYSVITDSQIKELGITPQACISWVEEAFRHKDECLLSPKVSLKPTSDSFFTTMPCCIPAARLMGVKVVSRLPQNHPPLKSQIMLFDMDSGDLVSLMDGNWITSMRTGAVAALTARMFVADFDDASFGFVGLGNIARAVATCLFSTVATRTTPVDVWLLKFGDETVRFIADFAPATNIRFHVTDSREELVRETSALFSCVTVMNDQFLSPSCYPKGYTLIPVHTKGFQDCDLVFDHVFGDDVEHERSFKNFDKFKTFAEMRDVILGHQPGRVSPSDRILCYNVGIALHDIWFASKIYSLCSNR